MRGWKSIATGLIIAVGTLTTAQADPLETTPRFDRDQLHCLALTIYHETRGESDPDLTARSEQAPPRSTARAPRQRHARHSLINLMGRFVRPIFLFGYQN